MNIKVEPFMIKRGNKVGKAAIEFTDEGILKGFHLVGFTICDDKERGLFVLFPASITKFKNETQTYFFLRPSNDKQLEDLETAILDVYESMIPKPFNTAKVVVSSVVTESKK